MQPLRTVVFDVPLLVRRGDPGGAWEAHPDVEPTLRSLRAAGVRVGVASELPAGSPLAAYGLCRIDAEPGTTLFVGDDARAAAGAAAAGVEALLLPPAPPGAERGLARVLELVGARLDHVQVAAPPGCEAEARRFYGELLGLAEVEKPPALAARGGAWFRVGAQQLHVGVEREFAPARKAHPALRVADVDALARRLAAAGVEPRWDDELPGVRRFYAADPWGNRLELLAGGVPG